MSSVPSNVTRECPPSLLRLQGSVQVTILARRRTWVGLVAGYNGVRVGACSRRRDESHAGREQSSSHARPRHRWPSRGVLLRAAAKADKLFRDRGIHPRTVDRSAAVVAPALFYDMLQVQLAAVGAS